MVTQLTNVLEGARVRVKQIEKDPKIRYELSKLGIEHGEILRILKGQSHQWLWSGIFRIKINGDVGVIEQHTAKLVIVEKDGRRSRLIDSYQGESGKVILDGKMLPLRKMVSLNELCL
jgi:Fe2+ transport system protein FeoA